MSQRVEQRALSGRALWSVCAGVSLLILSGTTFSQTSPPASAASRAPKSPVEIIKQKIQAELAKSKAADPLAAKPAMDKPGSGRNEAVVPTSPMVQPETPAAPRLPYPAAATLQRARDEIHKTFQEEFANAKSTTAKAAERKVALATKLEDYAQEDQDPLARLALRLEAAELAAAAAAYPQVDEILQEADSDYIVDIAQLKVVAFAKVAETLSEAGITSMIAAVIKSIDVAEEDDDFATAGELEQFASGLLIKLRAGEVKKRNELKLAEVHARALASTQLQKKPDDPASNLLLGKYFCFTRNDWPRGATHLVKGNDAALAALAKQELANPQASSDQTQLADGWWDLGQSLTGPSKAAVLVHAGSWYEQAGVEATGIAKIRIDKRLDEVQGLEDRSQLADAGDKPKAPVSSDRVRALEASAQACRSAEEALLLYQIFLNDEKSTKEERSRAQARLEFWQQAAAAKQVRVGRKWMLPADAEKLKQEADKLVDEAIEMLAIDNVAMANQKLDKASKVYPDHLESLFLLAVGAYITNDVRGAEKRFGQCLSRAPNHVPLLNNVAVCEMQSKKFDKAVRHWQRAAELEPANGAVIQNLGRFLADVGKRKYLVDKPTVDRATEVYQTVVSQGKLRADPDGKYVLLKLFKSSGSTSPEEQQIVGNGTGFVIAPGYVLTNRHVVADADSLVIRNPDDPQGTLSAKVVAVSKDKDLALLECRTLKADPVVVAPLKIGRGTEVLVLGYPITSVVGSGLKATRGIVTGLPSKETDDMLVLDAQVNPGNSGGPLADKSGRVVGVVSAKTFSERFVQCYGLAIPIRDALPFIQEHIPTFKPSNQADEPLEWTAVDARISPSTVLILIRKKS